MGGQRIKICLDCGIAKPHCAKGFCYSCYSMRDYYKHRETRKITMAKYQKNPDKIPMLRKYAKLYYSSEIQKNKASIREHKRYLEYRDQIVKRNHLWQTSEVGRLHGKLRQSARRAKIKTLVHNFSYDDWLNKLRESSGVCQMCNEFIGIEKLTLDHIVPINKVPMGFIYTINDVQPLCKSCNSSKKDKILNPKKIKSEVEIYGRSNINRS